MARSPLFSLIRRSLRLQQQSLQSGESIDTLMERIQNERAMSRRSFVAGSAGLVATAALAGCRAPARVSPAPQTTGDAPVIIIGAGIAGLIAAYRLRNANVPIRIIEAQNRIGGRMFSLRNYFADGQVCELGGELIDTGHENIQKLAAELGITLNDLSTDDATLRSDVWFFGGQARTEAEVIDAFRPIAERIILDLSALGGDLDPTWRNPQGTQALDRMTVAQWLDRAGVSGWMRQLLEVGYTTEYGLELDQQSALNLLLMISTELPPFKIFGESDERFHVQGGNDLIVQALAKKVQDAIELNTMLESVVQRGDGQYQLALRRDATSSTAVASHVLLAIPFTMLRQVKIDAELSGAKRRAIADIGYGTNAKLMVGFSSRVWREQHRSNGSTLTDLPYQLTWETSRLQPGRAGILTNFTGGRHGVELGTGTDVEQAAKLVGDLERIYPGISATRAGMKEVRFHWPTNRWVRGSYSSYHPGQWTSMRGAEGETEGRLFFAGEHCSLSAQGYMEGGCETGETAASAIAASLGKSVGVLRRALLQRALA